MIHFLVTAAHPYTLNIYLQHWQRKLTGALRPIAYEQIALARSLQPGTYIFADLERLEPPGMELARNLWDTLAAAGNCTLLNNPHTLLRREPLLRALHQSGKNPFAVYRIDEDLSRIRFPAFIRLEHTHDGPIGGLLHSPAEFNAALDSIRQKIRAGEIPGEHVLIIEFCDLSDADGTFRKYSVFRIGDHIVPRHAILGKNWEQRLPERLDPAALEEEQTYVHTNPHQSALMEIFNIAHIDYGRIDYGIKDGRLITWEINTNPTLLLRPHEYIPPRYQLQLYYANLLDEAFLALDRPAAGQPIPFHTPPSLLKRLNLRTRDRVLRRLRRLPGRMRIRLNQFFAKKPQP